MRVIKPEASPIAMGACTICRWYEHEPESYKLVTDAAMQGLSFNEVARRFNDYILETGNTNVSKLDPRSVSNHFQKHLSAIDSATLQEARKRNMIEGVPMVDQKTVEKVSKGNFDEYIEICKLFTRFKETHNKIYEYTTSIQDENANNPGRWSQSKVNTYVSMVNTQRQILADIAKMRRGEKLVSIAAKYIIEQFTSSVLAKLKMEMSSFIGILRRHDASQDLIEAFETTFNMKLGDIFIDEAESAMSLTKKEFKLPN